jgi:hypothetical protein
MHPVTISKADLVAALRERLPLALPVESLATSLEGLTLRPEHGAQYGLARNADRSQWVLTYDPADSECQLRRGIIMYLLSNMGMLRATSQLPVQELIEALWPERPCPARVSVARPRPASGARLRRAHRG